MTAKKVKQKERHGLVACVVYDVGDDKKVFLVNHWNFPRESDWKSTLYSRLYGNRISSQQK
jgi:hypothetical protein